MPYDDLSTRFNRRTFLQRSGVGLTLLALPACVRKMERVAEGSNDGRTHTAQLAHDSLHPIGLQLFTVRDALRADFDGTLARVAATGYREVEMAGYAGKSATQVRDSLRAAGLTAPSAHVDLGVTPDDWARVLDDAHTIGHKYIVIPAISAVHRQTLDDWRRVADRFNHAGEAASKAGITFAYHNHNFEFVPINGQVPYDLLLGATDPALVSLEIDLYWMTRAGRDPLTYFARWPGRVKLVHVKDSAGPPEYHMTDVGAGTIDWRRIFAHREQAGIAHYFVERDDAPDPFASITASWTYLQKLDVPVT